MDVPTFKGEMADTPHGADHPLEPFRKREGYLKKSIYFGILLFVLRRETDSFTAEQQLWIVNYSRKLSDEELLRAGKLTERLLNDEQSLIFHHKDIQRVRRTIPWIEPFNSPEAVRIGKGYTDKGALRPSHERGRQLSELKFWDEDIPFMLPTNYSQKGKWITADEVESLLGTPIFGLVMMSLNQMMHPSSGILSSLQMIQNRRR